jgi:hypothetical protein
MESINVCFDRVMIVARQDEATRGIPMNSPVDMAERSVKFRAAVRVLPAPFSLARKYMDDLLAQNKDGRDELLRVFGDCQKIAHIRQVITKLTEVLPPAKDDVLAKCSQACQNIEGVLIECGYEKKLQEMMEQEKEAVEDLVRKVSAHELPSVAENEEPDVGSLVREVSGRLPIAKMSAEERHSLLKEIDDLYGTREKEKHDEALVKVSVLFSDYADGLGFLEGQSYDLAVDDLTRYVQMEWDSRNKRYREKGLEKLAIAYEEKVETDSNFLRDWVLKTVDPDKDCCITKSEAITGFLAIVKDIDS